MLRSHWTRHDLVSTKQELEVFFFFFFFAWRFGWQTNGLRKINYINVHVKLLIHQFEEVQEQIMACVGLAGRIMVFRRPESRQ
jgi:hypothetical protein